MQVRDALRRYPLFALLDGPRLDAWLAAGSLRSLDLGETLFTTGTPGQQVFLVIEGRVRVYRAGRAGREVSLGAFRPGEVFGEYALLAPGLNTATCRAAAAGKVVRLPLGPLREWLAERPEVHKRLKRWLRLHALLGYAREGPFLGFMSATSLLPLLDLCRKMRYQSGWAIQADGLATNRWFLIQNGQVRLSASAGPPRLLGPGDCFGEGALLGGTDLPLAEALGETECLALWRDDFEGRPHGTRTLSLQTRCSPSSAAASFAWLPQQNANDCGAAALAMAARCHGLDVTVADVRRRLRLEERGASLLEMQQAATALGLGGRAVRIGAAQLAQVTWPALALLEGGHYVVVFDLPAGAVVVGDPARGVVKMDLTEFGRLWGGHLLLLTPPAPARC